MTTRFIQNIKNNNSFLAFLILLIAGGCSVFAFAPHNITIMIIISILLLLFVINNLNATTSKKTVFFSGYLYGLIYFATQLYWAFYSLYKVIDTGLIIALIGFIAFVGFISIYMAIITLVYCKLKSRINLVNLVFLFPSIWVLSEWLRSWILTGFPWCEIGYTMVNLPIFKGVYPLFGSYAVSWLALSLIGGLFLIINAKLTCKPLNKNSLRLVLFYFLVVLLSCSFISDINYTKAYGKKISVALIQGNIAQSFKWNTNDFLSIYQQEIAKARADLIVIPETAISTYSEDLPAGYLDNLTRLAESNGANLIIGIPKIIDKNNNYVNAAMLLTNPKHPYYAKYHLVPYGEYIPAKWLLGKMYSIISLPMVGFSAGEKDQLPLVVGNQKLAFNICYENGFNTELIKSTRDATIMANLSDMIWYGDTSAKDEHLQISQARALENQRYFIQDTNTGLTAIIRPDGVIQSQLPPFVRETLIDEVQGLYGTTPFEKYGNYPIIMLCVLMIILGYVIKKRYGVN